MNKVHYQDDHEELFKLCGGQMSFLIEDTASLEKRAASRVFGKEAMEQHRPDKDHFLQHLVAMASQEAFGCFFAGAPVQTKEGSKPIETIKTGDLVLTHTGEFKPVNTCFTEWYDGDAIKISVQGLPEDIESTSNHPFYVVDKSNITPDKIRERNLSRKGLDLKTYLDNLDGEYRPAEDITAGDYVVRPFPKGEKRTIITPAYLAGVYLAEGCCVKEYRQSNPNYGCYKGYVLSLNNSVDIGITDRLNKDLISADRTVSTIQPSNSSEFGLRYSVYWTESALELSHLVGNLSQSKFIHPDIFEQKEEWILNFLAGYLDGDGCRSEREDSRKNGVIGFSTASRDLALDLQLLFGKVGIPVSISKGSNLNKNACFGKQDHVIWECSIGSSYSNKVLACCERLKEHNKKSVNRGQSAIKLGTYAIFLKVNSVRLYYTAQQKFNLEVADNNTYVVDIQGHNSNRNGDAWPEDMLKSSHNTFVTHGHYYREHRNKNPETQGIGIIKASAYWPEMNRVELLVWGDKKKAEEEYEMAKSGKALSYSMSCFPAGTPVATSDGLINIEDIKEGTLVRTHTGELRPVTATMSREARELHTINFSYYGRTSLEVTAEHPLYVATFDDIPGQGRKDTAYFKRVKRDQLHKYLKWEQAKKVGKGHFIAIPIPKVDPNDIDPAFAKFLGYVIGDGCINFCKGNPNNISFTVNWNDIILDEIEKIVATIAPGTTVSAREHNLTDKALIIDVFSAELTRKCLEYLQGYASDKKVPLKLFGASDEARIEFIRGWINSDGWQDCKGIHVSTSIWERAVDLQKLYAACGLGSTITRIDHTESYSKLGISSGIEYVVNLGNSFSEVLAGEFSKVEVREGRFTRVSSFVAGDYLFIPVKSNTKKIVPTKVYNFSVEEHETYVVHSLAVHNCRVPYDTCSICEHQAKTAAQYCDHLKYNMLQYMPEHEKYAFAVNPKGTFFDISRVINPADRIAHFLEYKFSDDDMRKAASAQKRVILGSEWAEYEGVMIPEEDTSNVIPMGSIEMGKLAKQLAAKENDLKDWQNDEFMRKAANSVARAFSENISKEELVTLKSMHPGVMVRKMASVQAVLNFPSFAAYALGLDDVDALQDNEQYKQARRALPNVFSRLVNNGGSECLGMFKPASDFTMGCAENQDVVDKFMSEMDTKFGIKSEPMESRIIVTVMGGEDTSEDTLDCGCGDKEASVLADAYGAYQLQQLEAIKEASQQEINELALNAIITHNSSLYR